MTSTASRTGPPVGIAPAIEVAGVHKHFDQTFALRGIDLNVEHGSVLGLLGPNGAGKSALVRILTTLLRPDAGTVQINGIDVVRMRNGLGISSA